MFLFYIYYRLFSDRIRMNMKIEPFLIMNCRLLASYLRKIAIDFKEAKQRCFNII